MVITSPSIGITLDSEPGGGFSAQPWYACRQNYFDAVVAAGGLPWALPHEVELADTYVARLDGVLVTSGHFDVHPRYYGGGPPHAATIIKERRTAFEHALVSSALAADLPVLGVAGGHQLLNVVLGGTLMQHLVDERPDAMVHEQSGPRSQAAHVVEVVPDTLLHRITGVSSFAVNSAHHQAADAVGEGVVVAARAPDGVIEAIEAPRHRFAIGVQWNPEYYVDPADGALLVAFVEACRAARPG